jgi:magnesium-transporting ATPase (P-type)
MDSLGALALATEPPTDDLLLRQPYGRNDPILNIQMIKNIFLAAVYQLGVVLYLLFAPVETFLPVRFSTFNSRGEQVFEQCFHKIDRSKPTELYAYDECVKTTRYTVLFNAFVLMQLANQINSRKLRDELNVFEGLLGNRIFIIIEVGSAFVQALIVQFGGAVFKVHPLNAFQWGISIAFGIGNIYIYQNISFDSICCELIHIPIILYLRHASVGCSDAYGQTM